MSSCDHITLHTIEQLTDMMRVKKGVFNIPGPQPLGFGFKV